MKWQFESYGVRVNLEAPDSPETLAIMLQVVSKTMEIADAMLQVKARKDLVDDVKALQAPLVPVILPEVKGAKK